VSTSNKYKEGDFGYWWTVTLGKEDIEGLDYVGDLDVSNQGLTGLRGAPRSVSGNFWCDSNRLTSLEHCPQNVGESFYCNYNNLKSLKHCPDNIGKNFSCGNNNLTSLEYFPNIVGEDFYCNDNQLNDLTHAPRKINRAFECENNSIADPLSEIIDNDIVAKSYLVAPNQRITFKELEAEKQRRANIKRQLGPFAITVPDKKL